MYSGLGYQLILLLLLLLSSLPRGSMGEGWGIGTEIGIGGAQAR